jgi:glycosyltransferase involved in cell wall biosynthesis
MRYLFIHPVFPGQFLKMMAALAAEPGNEVTHISRQASQNAMRGVKRVQYSIPPDSGPVPHPFLQKINEALRHGDAVCRVLLEMRAKGYRPDVILSYAGHGQNFYIKDVFPDVPLLGYFEWYLNAFGSEYNFDPDYPLDFDRQRFIRINNLHMLADLSHCDGGITPTHWQQAQFPKEFRSKLHVLHDGVDTGYYAPQQPAVLKLGEKSLAQDDIELVTYSTRGMEPFRGFPEFMRALAVLQAARPKCHAVIVGTDEIFYSRKPKDAVTYKESLLKELAGKLDLSRVHFTGWLQPADYREVLRASRAHVYLTYPYVLSWSLMESMSTGCLVVGSRTPPVMEVIRDRDNGLLVDFPGHAQLAQVLEEVLSAPTQFDGMRARARQTVLEHYDQRLLVPEQVQWLRGWVKNP